VNALCSLQSMVKGRCLLCLTGDAAVCSVQRVAKLHTWDLCDRGLAEMCTSLRGWPTELQTGSRSQRRSGRSSPSSRASSQVPHADAVVSYVSSLHCHLVSTCTLTHKPSHKACWCRDAGLVPPGPLGNLVKSISAAQVGSVC
jgi:hypothetical protein